jgi:phosphoglucomutase/phosphomannomutase
LITQLDLSAALDQVHSAVANRQITDAAGENLRAWLTEDRYLEYREPIVEHVRGKKWKVLDDVFWTVIPFGTGGRRGRMYPFGSNAINDRTIGESAQGLADYVVHSAAKGSSPSTKLRCAIAYDTRHNSRRFAELCAGVMVAAGFEVVFLDDYRATPQLSFAVRHFGCACGIMVTASHNPPADNAVKVYWSTGAQVLPPHDGAIIQRVMSTQTINVAPFQESLAKGRIRIVTKENDEAFLEAAAAQGSGGPREVKILYTPLHGVGAAAVLPLLARSGFQSVTVFEPHAEPSGDFPNVPGHVSNPENTAVFDAPIDFARKEGLDVILATDPDCDRLGVAAPLTTDSAGTWGTFNGNQIGALLADFVLSRRKSAHKLTPRSFTVTTLVSSGLIRAISAAYQVRCFSEQLVGFKWIAQVIDREGADDFVYGCEESHGYQAGSHTRDKDGAVACLLMSELAAELKSQGKSLHDQLELLYRTHGRHHEHLINVMMEGSEGMALMQRLMAAFRERPPQTLGGLAVKQLRDYENMVTITPDGVRGPLTGPKGDLVIFDLEEPGNSVAVRPSGTEPKVKFYLLTRLSIENSRHARQANEQLLARAKSIEGDVRAFASSIK